MEKFGQFLTSLMSMISGFFSKILDVLPESFKNFFSKIGEMLGGLFGMGGTGDYDENNNPAIDNPEIGGLDGLQALLLKGNELDVETLPFLDKINPIAQKLLVGALTELDQTNEAFANILAEKAPELKGLRDRLKDTKPEEYPEIIEDTLRKIHDAGHLSLGKRESIDDFLEGAKNKVFQVRAERQRDADPENSAGPDIDTDEATSNPVDLLSDFSAASNGPMILTEPLNSMDYGAGDIMIPADRLQDVSAMTADTNKQLQIPPNTRSIKELFPEGNVRVETIRDPDNKVQGYFVSNPETGKGVYAPINALQAKDAQALFREDKTAEATSQVERVTQMIAPQQPLVGMGMSPD